MREEREIEAENWILLSENKTNGETLFLSAQTVAQKFQYSLLDVAGLVTFGHVPLEITSFDLAIRNFVLPIEGSSTSQISLPTNSCIYIKTHPLTVSCPQLLERKK